MQDLMKTGEGRSRIDMDDETGQTKRARVEASVNDEPMSVERSEGQGHHLVSTLSLTLLSLSFLSLLWLSLSRRVDPMGKRREGQGETVQIMDEVGGTVPSTT